MANNPITKYDVRELRLKAEGMTYDIVCLVEDAMLAAGLQYANDLSVYPKDSEEAIHDLQKELKLVEERAEEAEAKLTLVANELRVIRELLQNVLLRGVVNVDENGKVTTRQRVRATSTVARRNRPPGQASDGRLRRTERRIDTGAGPRRSTTMNATITITVRPSDYVPTEDRVTWLEKHGAPAVSADVKVTAPIALWEKAGARISPTGEIEDASSYLPKPYIVHDPLHRFLHGTIRNTVVETGKAPEEISETELDRFVTAHLHAEEVRKVLEAAETKTRLEREEVIVAEVLSRPTRNFLRRHTDGDTDETASLNVLRSAVLGRSPSDDSRVAAKVDELKALAKHDHEAWRIANEECTKALRQIALRTDNLARPAAEGYAIEQQVLDLLAASIVKLVVSQDSLTVHTLTNSACYLHRPDRAAPSPRAFQLYDTCTAAITTANNQLPAAIGTWSASRILRIDTCPHRSFTHMVTAVLLTLKTLAGYREVVCSLEPLACDHDED